MAEKKFWSWLNMSPGGGEIPGESGSGQQYFATKERKRSLFWSAVYRVAAIAAICLMLPLMAVVLVASQLAQVADCMLDWLDRKAG